MNACEKECNRRERVSNWIWMEQEEKKQKINQLYYLNRFKNSFERTDKKEFIKHDKWNELKRVHVQISSGWMIK